MINNKRKLTYKICFEVIIQINNLFLRVFNVCTHFYGICVCVSVNYFDIFLSMFLRGETRGGAAVLLPPSFHLGEPLLEVLRKVFPFPQFCHPPPLSKWLATPLVYSFFVCSRTDTQSFLGEGCKIRKNTST